MGLWDLHQELAIDGVRDDARLAASLHDARLAVSDRAVDRVEVRLEALLLLTDAVWELAGERLGLTEADLLAKVAEIDARDGTVDGRRVSLPRRCSQCRAAISNDRATCAFCGHAEPGRGAFDGI